MIKKSVSIWYSVLLISSVALAQIDTSESRPWKAPNYSGQEATLGYQSDVFATPKGMGKQVQFWIDVYTKYTSNQGIIHDSEDIAKIYQVVDLTGLTTDKEKQKKIDEVKKVISADFSDKEQKDRLRFQLGQKDRMRDAIFYSGRYLEDMEKIFREEKIPVELTRLVFVESSFNIFARSKVGASGIWQIMPYTARPYRMISSMVDKRNHPIEATRVAAKLFRQNYSMLESWPLAITGYNHGPTGVRKLTEKYKTRELAELVSNVRSSKTFGFASRNFYASFLAALEVERQADKYYESVVWSKVLDAQDLKLPSAVSYKEVLNWFDGDDRKFQTFNPHINIKVRKGHKIPARTVVAVPKDKYNVVLISLAKRNRMVAMEDKKIH